jgi:hypothetical protein
MNVYVSFPEPILGRRSESYSLYISVSPPYVAFNDDSRIYINISVDPCRNDNVCPILHWLV